MFTAFLKSMTQDFVAVCMIEAESVIYEGPE